MHGPTKHPATKKPESPEQKQRGSFIECFRTWRAMRRERRRALISAKRQALLIALGGTVTCPRTRK